MLANPKMTATSRKNTAIAMPALASPAPPSPRSLICPPRDYAHGNGGNAGDAGEERAHERCFRQPVNALLNRHDGLLLRPRDRCAHRPRGEVDCDGGELRVRE